MTLSEAGRPNLFQFATSELSQDAFICWLVSHVDFEGDPALNRCAKEFVALMYMLDEPSPEGFAPTVEKLIGKPEKQHKNTDVYFRCKIDGQVVSFIVEDKTYTSLHSDQLQRYKKTIQKDGIPEDELKLIYFKTGYVFSDEKEKVEEAGYAVLNCKTLSQFLEKHAVDNAIFADYRDHVSEIYREYSSALNRLSRDADGYEAFNTHPAQWEFMMKLEKKCLALYPNVGQTSHVYRGTSFGKPWIQWICSEFPGAIGDVNEEIFYRLDRRVNPDEPTKQGYYLSLKQYGKVKDNAAAKAAKLTRLKAYRELFESITREFPGPLRFGSPLNDPHGANESEIGILFFDSSVNTVQSVLDGMPAIQREFVKRLPGRRELTK